MEDTYLPAFRAAVVEGHAGSVMCAYNAINGEPACANQFLLQHTLRGAWKFGGYVVSDCGAVHDIFEGHRFRPSQPQATAVSLMRGMDNECITFGEVTGHDDYQPYIDAMRKGYLPQAAVDTALTRLFTARMRLGMFDPPALDPYSRIPESELDSPAHRQLALKLAEESMVLLKNDGVLPLKGATRIAVVGPLADQTDVLLGNYHGMPSHTVSVLEGMRAAFPGAQITYVPGTQFLSNQGTVVPATALTTNTGQPGLVAEYRPEKSDAKSTPLVARTEAGVALDSNSVPGVVRGKPFNVRWTGSLKAPATGDYLIGVKANGTARLLAGDRMIAQTYGGSRMARIHLEKGAPVKLSMSYEYRPGVDPSVQLIWAPVNGAPDPAAVAAAHNADVVVAVVGITSALEGEEMPVSEPGFEGGDRTNLEIPEPEEALVRAVASAGTCQCDHRILVFGGGRGSCNCQYAERRQQSWRTPASDLLRRRQPAPEVRGLRDEGTHLSLLHWNAPLAVRLRPQLHELQLPRPQTTKRSGARRQPGARIGRSHQQRQNRGRRGGSALPELPRSCGCADPRSSWFPESSSRAGRQSDDHV
jgi:beta-glucosidase